MIKLSKTNLNSTTRNTTVDVLKGIFILFTVIAHIDWTNDEILKYGFHFWLYIPIPYFMIMSGYVNALSYDKNGINRIGQMYECKLLLAKLWRYISPFLMTFLIEIIYISKRSKRFFLLNYFKLFLQGGAGPGSYYFPIMIQFVFMFPIIYILVKKYLFRGVVVCGFVNLAFEVLKWAYLMNEQCYRLLVFRYILLIAVGVYAFVEKDRIKNQRKWIIDIICVVVGLSATIFTQYFGGKLIFFEYFTNTCMLCCLWIMPLMLYILRTIKIEFKLLELIGKASYHIFLTQMVFYAYGFIKIYNVFTNKNIKVLFCVVLCVATGIIFFKVESYFRNRIWPVLSKVVISHLPR